MGSLKRIWSRCLAWIARDTLTFLGVATVFLALAGATLMLYFEREQDIRSWKDALWYSFVTMTTVGYGDLYPKSDAGRLLGVLLMLLGVGMLGMLTGGIASLLVEKTMKKEEGLDDFQGSDHHVICGWNQQAERTALELAARLKGAQEVVIVGDFERCPVDHENVSFIRGDYTDEAVLLRAGVDRARSALILGGQQAGSRGDASAVLCVLTLETIAPDVYTCVELHDPRNKQHCLRAKADEVLVSGEMNSRMLAGSLLHPGSSRVFTELVTGNVGNTVFKVPVPESVAGLPFREALPRLHAEQSWILLAVESAGKFLVNPSQHVLGKADELFVVSPSRPESLSS